MIVSFSWTSAALLSGRKTVTRRDWSDIHSGKFYEGQQFDAWDFNPRNGGQRIGVCKIVSLSREPMSDMPDSDYEAEGFAYLHERYGGASTSPAAFEMWRDSDHLMWVVRFEPIVMATSYLDDPVWMTKYEKRAMGLLKLSEPSMR